MIAPIVFVVPFVFILVTAAKDQADAVTPRVHAWPTEWHSSSTTWATSSLPQQPHGHRDAEQPGPDRRLGDPHRSVPAMVGFVLQRRHDRLGSLVSALLLAGLIIPPAIVPTIFVLQTLGLFKTLLGLILVEVAFLCPSRS